MKMTIGMTLNAKMNGAKSTWVAWLIFSMTSGCASHANTNSAPLSENAIAPVTPSEKVQVAD